MIASARYVLALLVRNRLVALSAGFGAALVVLSVVLTYLTPGTERRTFFDVAYAGLEALAVAVPLLASVLLQSLEFDQRTLALVLARPVTRPRFMAGRWLGMTAAAWCSVAAVAAVLALLAGAARALPEPFFAPVLIAALLEAAVVAAVACLVTALTTAPVTALTVSAGITLLGYLSGILPLLARRIPSAAGRAAVHALYWVLPHYADFAARDFTSPAESWYLSLLAVYAAGYAAVALLAAIAVFRGREI
ncbi:MAG: hypothetical protein AAB368_15860 [bacterium]